MFQTECSVPWRRNPVQFAALTLQLARHPQWGIQGDNVANGILKPRKHWVDQTFLRTQFL